MIIMQYFTTTLTLDKPVQGQDSFYLYYFVLIWISVSTSMG